MTQVKCSKSVNLKEFFDLKSEAVFRNKSTKHQY